MIVDSSALMAIVRQENEAARCTCSIVDAEIARISPVNLMEVFMMVNRASHPEAQTLVDQLLAIFNLTVEPVTEAQVRLARDAHRRFGPQSNRIASMTHGDCFAHALARDFGEPILSTGQEFENTGISIA